MEKTSAPVAPSESAIRTSCGARVFERGQALARARNLKSLTRAGAELFARCAGSYGEPYQLYARLENGAVAQSSCSCPFEGGGWCKHLVALLLRYHRAPTDFRETPPLSEMIGALSREDLNGFLENLMRREPQLLASLTQIYAANSAEDAGEPTDLRARLRGALSGRAAVEGRVALELAVNEATQARAKNDWARACEVWRVMLEELVGAAPHFEEAEDEEPDWDDYYEVEVDVGQDWVDGAVIGLLDALQQELAPPLRAEILQTLWQCWRDAQDCSHLELDEEALDPVLDAATAPLWNEVEAFLLERLRNPVYARHEYNREAALELLARGWNARGQGERANETLRQYGSYAQRLALLMEEKNYAGAETLALQNEDSHQPNLLAVADEMEGVAQLEIAQRLALRARVTASDYTLAPILDWLARFYLRRQNAGEAQEIAAALFVVRPDVAALQLWKSAIALDGDWDNRYPRLEKASAMTTPLRLQMAILDGRAPRALELFRLLNDREKSRFSAALARVCEAELPEKAIELYKQLGEAQVAARSNDNPRAGYRIAAEHWKRARELHKNRA